MAGTPDPGDSRTEHVEFICPHCEARWSAVYTVRSRAAWGEERTAYYVGTRQVLSPYTEEGAPPCPKCRSTRPCARRTGEEEYHSVIPAISRWHWSTAPHAADLTDHQNAVEANAVEDGEATDHQQPV